MVVPCGDGPTVRLHDILDDIQPQAAALAAPAAPCLISPPELLKEVGKLLLRHPGAVVGKAQTFGLVNGTPVFGLPGNPAAAYCGFEMLIRPALRKMQGYSNLQRPLVKARLARDAKKGDTRRIYLRATITKDADGAYTVEPAKNQSSGLFGVIQRSNCLAVLPEGGEGRTAGSLVECILLDVNEDVCL